MAELNSFLTSIADAIRSKKGTAEPINASNFASEIESIPGGGSGAKLKTLGQKIATPVPNSGKVETVYFNTELSVEEVVNIIANANLTYIEGMNAYLVLVPSDGSIGLAIQYMDGMCMIADMINNQFYFHNIQEAEAEFGFIGWNPSVSSISINQEVLNEMEGMPVGFENNKIADIFAIKYEYLEGETIELKNEYQGIELKITENGKTDISSYIKEKNEIPVIINSGVPVPEGYLKPTGQIEITSNGVQDISKYAEAYVDVHEWEDKLVKGKQVVGTNYTSYSNSRIGHLNSWVFRENVELESIYLTGMYAVKEYAFANCTALETVDFPSLTSINNYVFQNCTALKEYVSDKLTQILGYAFQNCTSLVNINTPAVTYIGEKSFIGCTALKTVNFPELTTLANFAFQDCTSLTSVSFAKITSTYTYAFQDCTSLTSVNIPLATTIGMGTFNGCYNLEKIELPAVTKLENACFSGCSKFTTLIIRQESSVCNIASVSSNGVIRTSVFENTPIAFGSGTIYVPDSLVDSYKSHDVWSLYASQIKPLSEYVE